TPPARRAAAIGRPAPACDVVGTDRHGRAAARRALPRFASARRAIVGGEAIDDLIGGFVAQVAVEAEPAGSDALQERAERSEEISYLRAALAVDAVVKSAPGGADEIARIRPRNHVASIIRAGAERLVLPERERGGADHAG